MPDLQTAKTTPTAVGEGLHSALWAMRTHTTRALLKAGLTGSQTGVLWFLHEYKELSLARLVELQGGTAANMTGMVQRLEREGLVRRKPHPTDRRVQIVELTEEGTTRTRKARKAVEAAMAHLLEGASQADLDVVLRVLHKLRDRADQDNPLK
jgi:DNA-binding MarR family transcriptional regulator